MRIVPKQPQTKRKNTKMKSNQGTVLSPPVSPEEKRERVIETIRKQKANKMTKTIIEPKAGIPGKVRLEQRTLLEDVLEIIKQRKFRIATQDEISPALARGQNNILIAIDKKVTHPETGKEGFFGYTTDGRTAHVVPFDNHLPEAVEIGIMVA